MKLFMYSFFVFTIASCAAKKDTTTTFDGTTDNSSASFSYKCTPCFGKCPYFSMDISGTTKIVIYKGKSNVTKVGTYTKTINDDELAKLVKAFDDAMFFQMNDKYVSNVTDLPSRFVSYTNYGKMKNIEDMTGAPGQLRTLERMLDDIANSEGWTQSDVSDQ